MPHSAGEDDADDALNPAVTTQQGLAFLVVASAGIERRRRGAGLGRAQVFSLYPVAKTRQTTTRHAAMKTSVIARLRPTPTSETP
jgi:hypothetical protein